VIIARLRAELDLITLPELKTDPSSRLLAPRSANGKRSEIRQSFGFVESEPPTQLVPDVRFGSKADIPRCSKERRYSGNGGCRTASEQLSLARNSSGSFAMLAQSGAPHPSSATSPLSFIRPKNL
jgi:hypothetical protein